MARSARTAPTTAQRAPSRQETLPAASSWRSAQTPLLPASTASSPNLRNDPPHQVFYHDHCSGLLQRFPKRGRYGHRDATMILIAYRHGLRASELVGLRWD